MQVGETVVLESFGELEGFARNADLFGDLEFARPVEDNHGKVLIKENIALNASLIARLKNHEGNYRELFEVKLTRPVITKLRLFLGREIARANTRRVEHDFVEQLLEDRSFSLADIVSNGLQEKRILLALLKVFFSDPPFFSHIARLGVLTLAVVLRANPGPNLRRHAFLAGLCADLALVDSEAWKFPVISGPAKKSLAEICARFAANFFLPRECLEAIARHPVPEVPERAGEPAAILPDFLPDVVLAQGSAMFAEILKLPAEGGESATPEGESKNGADHAGEAGRDASAEPNSAEFSPERAITLTQALRIARYLDDVGKRYRADPASFAEESIYMIAYLSGKGYFDTALSDRIIEVFRKYQTIARRMRMVANIESRCIAPPSAWAYPRPANAAQVLCKKRKYDCPHLVPSWSMHVVSPADAYGWLGAVLDPGEYPKCDLGEDLKLIQAETKAEEAPDES